MDNLRNSRRNRVDLVSNCESVRSTVEMLFEGYVAFRAGEGKRVVNASDHDAYKHHIELILLDIQSVWEGDPTRYIGYSRRKPSFIRGGAYWGNEKDRPLLSPTIFLEIIRFFETSGLIENHKADAGASEYSSRMRATRKFESMANEHGINWACMQIDSEAPVVFVKDEKKNLIPFPDPKNFDLEQAIKHLRRINANLQATLINLNITDDDFEEIKRRLSNNDALDQDRDYREPLEFSNRSLKRIFAMGNFSNGGRFYGGWWQGVPSEYRKHIEIDGCVTVEMDFSTMQPRVLYAQVGHIPPEDSYTIDGWDPNLRKIIKKAFNQLVNSDKSSRNENQWHRFAPALDPHPLPDIWGGLADHQKNFIRRGVFITKTGRDYSELLRDLLNLHKPIENAFFSGAWGRMQYIDSQIAELVMIKLLDHSPRIVALPIHDSFIVRRGAEKALLNAMKEAFEEVVGVLGKVDRDVAVYDPPRGYEHSGPVVLDEELTKIFLDDLKISSQYHKRNADWERVYGLEAYD